MTQTLTYSAFGTPTANARTALAKALSSELELPAAAEPYLARAGRGDRADAYRAAVERVLDSIADHAAMEVATITCERDRLVRDAYEREQDELASAPRVDGLRRGPVTA